MNTAGNFPDDGTLDDTATDWLCEREEGFAPGRAQAFAAWRDLDPRHAAAVARVERTLALLADLPAVRAPLEARFGASSASERPAAPVSTTQRRLLSFPRPQILSALAAALVLGALGWWSIPSHVAPGEHYVAAAGAPRRVALRDGSVVDLNASSDARVVFGATERRVTLSSGEAHFQVAADSARPFVVTAGGVSVRAVGTAFNVRIAAGSVEVLVVEGKVEVAALDGSDRHVPAPRSLLVAGERTAVSHAAPFSAPQVKKAAPATIRAALEWQDPMVTFHDAPLRDVVTRLNARNPVQLVLEDAALGDLKIGGVVALDQVEAFVRLLEHDGDVVAERRGTGEIRLRRAR